MSQAAIAKLFGKSAIAKADHKVSFYNKDNTNTEVPYKGMSNRTYKRADMVKQLRAMDGYTEVPAKQNSDAKTQVNWAFKNDKNGDMVVIRASRSWSPSAWRTNSYSRSEAMMFYVDAASTELLGRWLSEEDQVAAVKAKRKEQLAKRKADRADSAERWINNLLDEETLEKKKQDLNKVPELWMGLRNVLIDAVALWDFNNLLAAKSRRALDTSLGRYGVRVKDSTDELCEQYLNNMTDAIVAVAKACKLKTTVNTAIKQRPVISVTGKQGTINLSVALGQFSRGDKTFIRVTQM